MADETNSGVTAFVAEITSMWGLRWDRIAAVNSVAVSDIDNRSKNKRGTLCCVPKCKNFGGHKFPSEATAKMCGSSD